MQQRITRPIDDTAELRDVDGVLRVQPLPAHLKWSQIEHNGRTVDALIIGELPRATRRERRAYDRAQAVAEAAGYPRELGLLCAKFGYNESQTVAFLEEHATEL